MSEPPSASDHTSLMCSSLDLQSRSSGSPDQEESISGGSPELNNSGAQSQGGGQGQDPQTQTPGTQPPSCPTSLPFQDMECQSYPENGNGPLATNKQGEAPTPDVDLLLECTFAYMQTSKEQDPMEEQEDDLLSPLIGPDDLDQDDPHHQHCLLDLEPPSCVDQMCYSLEPEQCPSSDEEDIYAVHGVPYSASSASLGDRLNALNLQGSNIGQQDQDKTVIVILVVTVILHTTCDVASCTFLTVCATVHHIPFQCG